MNKTQDNEENAEMSMDDKAFNHIIHKLQSVVYPKQKPRHVSEMGRLTDYHGGAMNESNLYDTSKHPIGRM